jgi:hypothetical protein
MITEKDILKALRSGKIQLPPLGGGQPNARCQPSDNAGSEHSDCLPS